MAIARAHAKIALTRHAAPSEVAAGTKESDMQSMTETMLGMPCSRGAVAAHGQAQGTRAGAVTVVLGPERLVRVSRARADDVIWHDGDPITATRHGLIADVAERISSGEDDPAHHALLVARDRLDRVVAVGAYQRSHDDHAAVICEVDRRYQNLGLGTFLLRRLAEIALADETHRFDIDVVAGACSLAEVLRDCGLQSHWDLGGPVTRVDLDLAHARPGWSTPECPIAIAETTSCAPA
jgi:GNAT superfamily N-acetyltransferase